MKSGNIIGEGFDEYVEKQIDIRQKRLSELDKTNESILVFNSSAPWLRLVSSVNITEEDDSKVKEILGNNFLNYTGDKLAKNFVLFGGVSTYSGSMASGVATSNGFNLDNSYGFGGLNNGLVPLPGIESVNITSYNRGSLRKAEIKLRAYNILQFYIIDILYMRVGYTALLEWGHSLYFDNNGDYQKFSNFDTEPFNKLFAATAVNLTTTNNTTNNNINSGNPVGNAVLTQGSSTLGGLLGGQPPQQGTGQILSRRPNSGIDQYIILEAIEKERNIRNCNYDGFFGKITNFNWSLTPNGAYDINITMISVGDVIESLKVNSSSGDEFEKNINTTYFTPPGTNIPSGEAVKRKNNLSTILNLAKNTTYKNINNNTVVTISKPYGKADNQTIISTIENESTILSSKIKIYKSPDNNKSLIDKIKNKTNYDYNFPFIALKPTKLKEGILTNDSHANGYITYIKLGVLLYLIQDTLLLYDKNKTPITKIDFDPLKNYMVYNPLNFSSNPYICVIPYSRIIGSITNSSISLSKRLTEIDQGFTISDWDHAANLMNLYVSVDHTLNIIESNIDEDGKVDLLKYLDTLMSDIQTSLGNLNKFTVTYDDLTNTIKIMDDNPLPFAKEKIENYKTNISTFNINGVQYGTMGSFINSVDLKAEISNELSTMISVGAQSNGNVVGANATAFSTWNKGLIDRIIPEKQSLIYDEKNPLQEFYSSLYDMHKLLDTLYDNGDWSSDEDISSLTQIQTDALNFYMGNLSQTNQISPPGFIPFNLGLNMKGLSGMKLYQTFKVTENLLPPTYNKNLRFIIKNLDHSIDSNGWITKIQSFTTGADPSGSVYTPISSLFGDVIKNINSNPPDVIESVSSSCGNPQIITLPSFIPHNNILKARKAMEEVLQDKKPLKSLSGDCSIYSYNYANNFLRALNNKPLEKISGKGHARELRTRKFLQGIGYKVYNAATSVSKLEIQKIIKSYSYNIGDMLIYASNDGDKNDRGPTQYGHIQIYNGSQWLSDAYQSSFVYKNYKNNCWDLYVLRAPIVS